MSAVSNTARIHRINGVEYEVVIIGAGPVGLLLALLLGNKGVRTLVIDKRTVAPRQSMAIGITPPSLNILRGIGLDQLFIREGLPIKTAEVHENGKRVGHLDFDDIASPFDYILSMPQAYTVELLWAAVDDYPSVDKLRGVEFVSLQEEGDTVRVQLHEPEWEIPFTVTTAYVAACDGCKSRVRRNIGIPIRQKNYRQHWVMADFVDKTGLGDEAHLFFGPSGSIESFPLPGGLRRWISLLPARGHVSNESTFLLNSIKNQAGYDLEGCMLSPANRFGAQRIVTQRFFRGRVALCGDAAHVMSSIGGQGMNTGFADADMLAGVLYLALRENADWNALASCYDRMRRESFKVAADRAAGSMWLGTRRGLVASFLRKHFIRDVLFSRRFSNKIAPFFAMLTIPHNRPTDEKFSWGAWLQNASTTTGGIA
jgi:2-polyprenyl-6-methoxyphenol hydroxylase-like FAD-dependent oxidoreductase